MNEQTAICIYRTMITPILDYGDIIYAAIEGENNTKLQEIILEEMLNHKIAVVSDPPVCVHAKKKCPGVFIL